MDIKLKKVKGDRCSDCAVRTLLKDSDVRIRQDAELLCSVTNCREEKIIYREA